MEPRTNIHYTACVLPINEARHKKWCGVEHLLILNEPDPAASHGGQTECRRFDGRVFYEQSRLRRRILSKFALIPVASYGVFGQVHNKKALDWLSPVAPTALKLGTF